MNSTREQGRKLCLATEGTENTERATEIYFCGFTANGYNTAMKKSLAHLPELEWDEAEQLAPCVKKLHEVTEAVCEKEIKSFV